MTLPLGFSSLPTEMTIKPSFALRRRQPKDRARLGLAELRRIRINPGPGLMRAWQARRVVRHAEMSRSSSSVSSGGDQAAPSRISIGRFRTRRATRKRNGAK